jgi:hypothetical protein
MDLLYLTAYWHSLAKLRMHTDSSLTVFESVTTELGKALRHFAEETCRHFKTVELDSEYSARARATTRRENSKPKDRQGADPAPPQPSTTTVNAATETGTSHEGLPAKSAGKRTVIYNLETFKNHSIGDCAKHIRRSVAIPKVLQRNSCRPQRCTRGCSRRHY